MTVLFLVEKNEFFKYRNALDQLIRYSVFSAHREDVDVDDGKGHYRPARREELNKSLIVAFDSKEMRKTKFNPPSTWQQCYCRILENNTKLPG